MRPPAYNLVLLLKFYWQLLFITKDSSFTLLYKLYHIFHERNVINGITKLLSKFKMRLLSSLFWKLVHVMNFSYMYKSRFRLNELHMIASEESFLLSMGDPKNAIKSLILVVEQFCIKHFLILFQF